MDFLHGDRVQEALDDTEDGRETPGGVDEVEFSETLRVVVLRDGGRLFDVAVDAGYAADAHAFEVHDRAAGFEEGAGFA